MPGLPVLKPREAIRILERLGFVEVRQRGSHRQFRQPDGRVTTARFIRAGTSPRCSCARSARTFAWRRTSSSKLGSSQERPTHGPTTLHRLPASAASRRCQADKLGFLRQALSHDDRQELSYVRLARAAFSVLLLAAACGKAADKRPANREGGRTSATCGAGASKIGPQQAVQCAEQFVARNGYTSVTLETIDRGRAIRRVLRDRYNMLQPRAAALCPGPRKSGGYMVAFARVGADTVAGRAVTMSATGSDLQLESAEFGVAGARRGQFGCRPLTQ